MSLVDLQLVALEGLRNSPKFSSVLLRDDLLTKEKGRAPFISLFFWDSVHLVIVIKSS